MTRQEIIAAIDSTIVPNKKKGITAESLRLVLREMASATPEGNSSSDIIKRIWLDEIGGEPSEEHLAENKATYEFFENGGCAVVLMCFSVPDIGVNVFVCDLAGFYNKVLSLSFLYDDNYYSTVANIVGAWVYVSADGHIKAKDKRSGQLIAYMPSEGKELGEGYKDYNKEIYDIIKSGAVPSPIMIKYDDATYTSAAVRFGTINEEIGETANVGFFRGTTNVMSVVCILSDGTVMEV